MTKVKNKQETIKNLLFYLIKEQEHIKDLEKEIAIYKKIMKVEEE